MLFPDVFLVRNYTPKKLKRDESILDHWTSNFKQFVYGNCLVRPFKICRMEMV